MIHSFFGGLGRLRPFFFFSAPQEAREVESSLAQIKLEKEEIERQQKELNKQLRKSTAEGSMPPPPSRGKGKFVQTTAYLLEQTEALRIRLSVLRKEESELMEKKDALESQKALLIREMRRLRDEKASPFNNMPVLHDRYQLTKLLGRGGFSEVRQQSSPDRKAWPFAYFCAPFCFFFFGWFCRCTKRTIYRDWNGLR